MQNRKTKTKILVVYNKFCEKWKSGVRVRVCVWKRRKNNSKATRPVFQATKPKKKNKQTQFFSTVAIPSINTTPIIRERERKATAHNTRVCSSFLALFLSLRSQSFCTLYNRLLLPLLPVSLPSPSPAWWMNGFLGCPNPKTRSRMSSAWLSPVRVIYP